MLSGTAARRLPWVPIPPLAGLVARRLPTAQQFSRSICRLLAAANSEPRAKLAIEEPLVRGASFFQHSKHNHLMTSSTLSAIKVTAVIPCLNEERTIGLCIMKALQSFRSMGVRG